MSKSQMNTRPDNRKQKGAKTSLHPSSRYDKVKKIHSPGKFAQELREYRKEKDVKTARKIAPKRGR